MVTLLPWIGDVAVNLLPPTRGATYGHLVMPLPKLQTRAPSPAQKNEAAFQQDLFDLMVCYRTAGRPVVPSQRRTLASLEPVGQLQSISLRLGDKYWSQNEES